LGPLYTYEGEARGELVGIHTSHTSQLDRLSYRWKYLIFCDILRKMQQSNVANNTDAQQREYNKKWKCYILIGIVSLTNFVSIGEAFHEDLPHFYFGRNISVNGMWGIVTFVSSLLILIFDLIGFIRNKFDFKSLKDGKVEGWTLFAFVLWWVSGVISITRAGAIGYASLNIYFSSWGTLFACIYTLNKWGGEKDILTLRELTRISITLPSWWVVFWASLIGLGSAADAIHLATTDYVRSSCDVAIGICCITAIVAAFFVLSHYEFFICFKACTTWLSYGGWFELLCSIIVNIWLVIGLDQLTGVGAIASTIDGNGASDPTSEDYVPGTNIWVCIWTAFIASVRVTVKWKEARAIRFAQTSGAKADNDEEEAGGGEDVGGEADTEIIESENNNASSDGEA